MCVDDWLPPSGTPVSFPPTQSSAGLTPVSLAPPHLHIGIGTRHDRPAQPGGPCRGPTRHVAASAAALKLGSAIKSVRYTCGKHQISRCRRLGAISRAGGRSHRPRAHRNRLARAEPINAPPPRRPPRHGVHHPLLAAPLTRPPIGEQLPQHAATAAAAVSARVAELRPIRWSAADTLVIRGGMALNAHQNDDRLQ